MPEKIMPKIQNPKSNKIPNHKTVKRFGIFSFLRFYWAYGKSKFQNSNSNKTPNKQNFKTFFYNLGFKGFRFYWTYGKSKIQIPKSKKIPNHKTTKCFGILSLGFGWALGIGLWVLVALFVPVATAPLIDSQVSADPGYVAVDIDYIVDPQITSDGLVGYWKFDESSAGTFADSSGHGNNGTGYGATGTNNTPQPNADVAAGFDFANTKSLSFDGTDDYTLIGDIASLKPASLTVSAWVYLDKTGTQGIAGNIDTSGVGGYGIWMSGASPRIIWDYGAGLHAIALGTMSISQWYHVAGTFTNGAQALYLNGTGVGSSSYSEAIDYTDSLGFNIGRIPSGGATYPLDGLLDDVRIYNRALSATEIAALAAGSHTSATWDGSSSTDWETAANWDINAVPDPFTNITIPDVTNQPVLTAAVGSANLTINSSATLDLAGFGYTFNDSGTFTNNGTLIMDGDETLTNFTNDLDSGTVLVNDGTSNTLTLGNYNNLTINDGLVGYWKFDESSAGTFADSSGYGNTGTGNGAAGSQNTPQPSATVPTLGFTNPYSLNFDGTDDYVLSSTRPLESTASSPFTLSIWLYPTNAQSTKGILSIDEEVVGGQPYLLLQRQDSTTVRWYWASGYPISQSISDNVWQHLVVTFNGSVFQAYLNGQADSETYSGTATFINTNDRLILGAGYNGYFSGLLDDVRIYNRALTATEISSLAAGTQPGTGVATYTLASNLDVNGTLTLNSGTLDVSASGCSGASCSINVAGSWENNGGKFTKRTGTVTFDGTSGSYEIQSGRQQFNTLTFNNAATWTLADRLDVTGTLSQSAGTLDVSTSNYAITAGDFDQTAGTFTSRSGTLTLNSSSNQTINTSSTLYNLNLEDPTESGLVGYWKFDEGVGTVASDSSGQGNNGTLTNNPKWTTTVPSGISFNNPYALSFDGTDDYVKTSSMDIPATYSVSAWIKLSTLNVNNMIVGVCIDSNSACTGGDYDATYFYVNSSNLLYMGRGHYTTTGKFYTEYAATPLTSNVWYHIIGIYEDPGDTNENISFYVNAESRISSVDIDTNPVSTTITNPFGIGAQYISYGPTAGSYFTGLLDDVRIYNRALSPTEVANLAAGKYADGDNGTATFTLNTNLDINGNLGLYSGILSAGSNTIDLAGNWNNYAGSSAFTAGTSTVDLDASAGSAQAVRGSNTFYNLEASTDTAQTISFESSATQTVTNALTFTGAASNLLTLAPETAATAWLLNAPSTQTISYTTPTYSNASGGTAINAYTNPGNADGSPADTNTNWLFTNPDTTPPAPSGFSPASASTITDSTPTITFTLDENGDCYASTDSDETYDQMSDDTNCTGDGTTSQSCTLADLGADGSKTIYVACKDTAYSNKDDATTNEHLSYTLDTTVPVPTVTAVGGDTSSTWSTSDTTPSISITLNETGDCYASETDESYDDMSNDTNCTGDGTTSIVCQMGTLSESASNTIYVSCQDTAGNKDTISSNEAITTEIDATPPTTSSFSPTSGSITTDSTPTITFNTNENGDCYANTDGDEAYDDMADDTNCTGDGTTSQSCTLADLGADGSKTIYFACKDDTDSTNNKDTTLTNDSITLTLDTTAPTTTDNFANHNTWVNSNQTITLTPADATSGVSWTKYCTDTTNECTPSTGTTYTTAVTISTEGTSYFRYASQDTAGNTQTTVSKTIKIDTQAPTSTIDSLRETNSITTTVTCVDGSGSGCSVTYYCTDTTNTCTPTTVYTAPVSYQITANTYFRTHSVDFVTNTSSVSSASLLLQGGSGGGGSYEQPVSIREIPIPNAQPNPNDQSPKFDDGLLDKLAEQIKDIGESISNFKFQISNSPEIIYPPIEQSVPQEAQIVFQGLDIFSINPLSNFDLIPIASDLDFFANKFTQLKDVLKNLSIDIDNLNDISKLAGTNLYLPGLTKTVLIDKEGGVPIVQLPTDAISKMPSNVVFARTAGELIDFSSSLSIGKDGMAEQKIIVISGKPIDLVIKPDAPAKNVLGFLILKKTKVSENTKESLFKYVLASLSLAFENSKQKENSNGLLVQKFEYQEVKDGVYKASILAPSTEGEYQVATVIEYKNSSQVPKETKLTAIVDSEGYVYYQMPDGRLRIKGAKVYLYWRNSETSKFELWPADKFLQKNPIITDDTGKYSFLVPQGTYYVKVEAANYATYKSEDIIIKENNNIKGEIELKKNSFMSSWVNWQTIIISLLILIIVLIMIMAIIFIKRSKIET